MAAGPPLPCHNWKLPIQRSPGNFNKHVYVLIDLSFHLAWPHISTHRSTERARAFTPTCNTYASTTVHTKRVCFQLRMREYQKQHPCAQPIIIPLIKNVLHSCRGGASSCNVTYLTCLFIGSSDHSLSYVRILRSASLR